METLVQVWGRDSAPKHDGRTDSVQREWILKAAEWGKKKAEARKAGSRKERSLGLLLLARKTS